VYYLSDGSAIIMAFRVSLIVLLAACAPWIIHADDERLGKAARAPKPVIKASYGEAQLVVIGNSKGVVGPVARLKATFPNTATTPLAAVAGQYLQLTFSITDAISGSALSPHQVFVRLTNKATRVQTNFVASMDGAPRGDDVGIHSLKLDLNDYKSLHAAGEAGDYSVTIVVGDPAISNPIVWTCGELHWQPATPPAGPTPILYSQPLLHESDTTLLPLKEIRHVFKEPENRPPPLVSVSASVIIVLGLVVYVVQAVRIPGFSITIVPPAVVWASGFYTFFAAIMAVFVAYWFAMNMFTALTYVSALAVPTALLGHKMLRALQKHS
jgi:oligosaccharyltransferase complex subunit delta (ribophorin II)